MLSSCARLGLRSSSNCREPQMPEQPANNAPLKVGAGQDLPDTRNAIKVPALAEPEKPRSKTDACLTRPPSFGS
jgi:hypothetical protein